MDELELLRKDWQRQEKNLPHVEAEEIKTMMHKKSKSIVKWILIISIAEFIFWIGLESLSFFQQGHETIREFGLFTFYRISLIISYVMIVVFIALFFRNYKKICTSDNVKSLIKNIIITRKTVKAYVWFNILAFIVSAIVVSTTIINQSLEDQTLGTKLISYGIIALILGIMLLIIIGFYYLLYGILTRRLYKNYEILKKIDKQD